MAAAAANPPDRNRSGCGRNTSPMHQAPSATAAGRTSVRAFGSSDAATAPSATSAATVSGKAAGQSCDVGAKTIDE